MRRLLLQNKRSVALVLFALLVVAVKTTLLLHLGMNLADEGFLWYGMQRVQLGEVPLRDFMAYDPARYYWGASAMWLMGSNGLVAFRLANALFEWVGLSIALLLISRIASHRAWLFLLFGCLTLSLWMIPRYKVYDHVASIALIASLAYLIDAPTRRRYFIAGVVLGLAAFIGRNHGAYGLAGTALAVLYINFRERPVPIKKAFLSWFCGALVGHSPMILLMVFVPGFANASMDMFRIMLAAGKTNLPLPVPWPWRASVPANWPLEVKIQQQLVGYFFIALLLFGLGSIAYVFWRRLKGVPVSAPLVACAALALPYAHYAFARAEMNHLSFGGFPLFVGMLLITRRFGGGGQSLAAFALMIASFLTVYRQMPGRVDTERVTVAGTQLTVDPYTKLEIDALDFAVTKYSPNGENFFITPFYPSAYPMYGRQSPVWDLYSLFDRDEKMQLVAIENIKKAKPAFVIIIDAPPDRDPFLLYRHTNPLVWKFLNKEYQPSGFVNGRRHLKLFLPRGVMP